MSVEVTVKTNNKSKSASCPDIQALISPKGYKVERTLGKGAYGVVMKAVHTKTNKSVAIKVINLEKLSDNAKNKMLPREIETLTQCHHEHLIKTYDVLQTGTLILIFMQFAPNGDLSSFAKKHKGVKDELACKWFRQASSGLAYLHGTLYRAHRDIKLANILLDDKWKAVLVDLGFAKKCYDEQRRVVVLSSTYCGTRAYECPQIVEHKPYNAFKADIWSLGVALWNMLHHRNYPFDHKDEKVMLKQMHKYPHHLRKNIKKELPKEALELFEAMLNPNERERASVKDILKNSWLKSKAAKGCVPSSKSK